MKRQFISLILIQLLYFQLFAQKNTTTVSKATLTGTNLPSTVQKDNSVISESLASALLEKQSSLYSSHIKNIEVLFWLNAKKDAKSSLAWMDSLQNSFKIGGWKINYMQNEPNYLWLSRKDSFILAYIYGNKKRVDVYLGMAQPKPFFGNLNNNQGLPDNKSNPDIQVPTGNAIPLPVVNASVNANDIAGRWSTTDVSIAAYVTSSGNFISDASVSTMEEYEFRNDYTYIYKFFGSANGRMYYTETKGRFATRNGFVSLVPQSRRGGYSGQVKDENELLDKPRTFQWYVGPTIWENKTFLNFHDNQAWYPNNSFPWTYFKKLN